MPKRVMQICVVKKLRYLMVAVLFLDGVAAGSSLPKEIAVDGLRCADKDDLTYPYAAENTVVLQRAVNCADPGTVLLIPDGYYNTEGLNVESKTNLTIQGAGRPILRRKAICWDNEESGDCPEKTALIYICRSGNIRIVNIEMDGNGYRMALKGYGQFDKNTRKIIAGRPQFPKILSKAALHIIYSTGITVEQCVIRDAFGWGVEVGQVDEFVFRRNVVNTGNLTTAFRGHYDAAPNDRILHVHSSQDGIHLVNVRQAEIVHNTVFSEDSGVAVEANVRWFWNGKNSSKKIQIGHNAIQTNSREDNYTDSSVYGSNLENHWVGLGAIDIFYWNVEDRTQLAEGTNALIKDISIYKNALFNSRYGIRAGYFIGAGKDHCLYPGMRINNLRILDHAPEFMAGAHDEYHAGIRHIIRADDQNVFNANNGGAAVVGRSVDGLYIINNHINDIIGGTGIDVSLTTDIEIRSNFICNVKGTELGSPRIPWLGGYGIRIWNEKLYDAYSGIIEHNDIKHVEREPVDIVNTAHLLVK